MTARGERGALHVEIEQAQPMRLSGAFACEAGELLALVGPSGAGKTSVLRVLAGLTRPQRARVTVGGETWCDTAQGVFLPPRARAVGMVFQDYALMPHLSALENVALALLHLPRGERLAQAGRWLEHVRLGGELQRRRPGALSGGQQQRVAVARALARRPRLLLLDEPFSAVDQLTRQELYRLLADLRRELSVPIVLVTHDLAEARMLADRLVVMDAGKVLQAGSPAAIHRAPRNARVADLVGIQNRFRGRWLGAAEPGWGRLRWVADAREDGQEDTNGDRAPDGAGPVLRVLDKGRIAHGQRVDWVLPGEAITLLDRAAQASDEFAATVVQVRHLGEITLVTLVLPRPGARMQVTLAGPSGLRIEPGATVGVRIDLGLVHVMPFRA